MLNMNELTKVASELVGDEWLKTITAKQLESFDFYLIGDSDREIYYPAIIGIARDRSHIAYSYERLQRCFMNANDWSFEEARERIEYNVIRALPYYGEKAPEILPNNFITKRNKKYVPLKIKLDI